MKILSHRKLTTEETEKLAASSLDASIRIKCLKKLLASTDYQAIKFAEGELSIEEYSKVKEQRAEWRRQINALENPK